MRILHISEAYGGGIVTAVRSFVDNSPQHEHHLLVSIRPAEAMALDKEAVFSTVTNLPTGFLSAWSAINQACARLKPDFVHLHSSYAGVYGRLALIPREKIIYSPHGFAFERRDFSAGVRAIFSAVESLLSLRTGRFAGVSRYEVERARRFLNAAPGFLLPNTWSISESVEPTDVSPMAGTRLSRVSFVGRLAPQKDPMMLVNALRKAREGGHKLSDQIEFIWYGGGSEDMKAALENEGVRVTGWMPHGEVMQGLQKSCLYVHTGAWEGFPMSVIEAAVLGCPVLLRTINAFDGYNFPRDAMFDSVDDLCRVLCQWVDGSDALRRAAEASRQLVLLECSPAAQRHALARLYAATQTLPALA